LGVDYTQLVPVLVEAVKELKSENEQLRVENKEINSHLSASESKG